MEEKYVKCVDCLAHYKLGNLHVCDGLMKMLVKEKMKKDAKEVKYQKGVETNMPKNNTKEGKICDRKGCKNQCYKGETFEYDGKEYCSEKCIPYTKKKKEVKEICHYCGQVVNREIWLKHTKKQLIKSGMPSLAKLLNLLQ